MRRVSLRPAILAAGIWSLGIFATLLIWHKTGTNIAKLTLDPAAVLEAPFYVGFLSQLGIMLWGATAGVCILSAAAAPSCAARMRAFLFGCGMFSVLFGLDDALLLHERVFPAHVGIPQSSVMWLYVFLGTVFAPPLARTGTGPNLPRGGSPLSPETRFPFRLLPVQLGWPPNRFRTCPGGDATRGFLRASTGSESPAGTDQRAAPTAARESVNYVLY